MNDQNVTTEGTDKGVTFTYISDHSCIIHCYEFGLNTDLDMNTTIEVFMQLLSNHNTIHYQPNQSYN